MSEPAGVPARRLAIEAMVRIEVDGAYANLVLPRLLAERRLPSADARLVTEIVYGATRMRRACDAAVEPYVLREPDPAARAALRIGVYQLLFLRTPAHAAVGATVGAVRGRARGMVNAVLRRIAQHPPQWPDEATALSYPDWIVARLTEDLGAADAHAAMAAMNRAATVTERPDGYIQDPASQWVAAAVGAGPGELVVDLCAAPGGKATALAATGANVVAVEPSAHRARLVRDNASRTGHPLALVRADGRATPLAPGTADRVLVDAPCSGLGALRRRPDARWRIDGEAVERLVVLQRELLGAAASLLRPGGTLVYSVCTMTAAETTGVDTWLQGAHPGLEAIDAAPPPLAAASGTPGEENGVGPWRSWGRGHLLLPQDADTDGMYVLRLCRTTTPRPHPTAAS